MAAVSSGSLIVFRVGEREFAVGVAVVERVVRAVEIAPLPEAPRGVRGIIDLQGQIVPVFDLAQRFGEPARAVGASDHLLIACTASRVVALLVEAVVGVVEPGAAQLTPTSGMLPDSASISGVLKLESGLVLVHDVDRFLSNEDDVALERALNP